MLRVVSRTALSRFSVSDAVCNKPSSRLISTCINPLFFKATACLYAEPLKKKKRVDPAILKNREERKKKRIEKQIRRLEKNARQLKPIDELEIPMAYINGVKERTRVATVLTPQEEEERALLEKKWTRYKNEKHMETLQMIDRLIFAQQKALDELRKESEELYQAAIQVNTEQIPFTLRGPMQTPPIGDYDSPDGEYNDVSKKW